jgi:hypothetical protein
MLSVHAITHSLIASKANQQKHPFRPQETEK